jgi:hypothetical protein
MTEITMDSHEQRDEEQMDVGCPPAADEFCVYGYRRTEQCVCRANDPESQLACDCDAAIKARTPEAPAPFG